MSDARMTSAPVRSLLHFLFPTQARASYQQGPVLGNLDIMRRPIKLAFELALSLTGEAIAAILPAIMKA
jgi:hypothetical protein